MALPKRLSRKPEEIRVQEIQFLGEQDGPPEQLLKNGLVESFQIDENVQRAYLARVSFGEGSHASVVLGLRTRSGPEKRLVETVGSIFASIFGGREHLDIMFLTDTQEAQLSLVCKPFFGA
jgi:hypothetical protein